MEDELEASNISEEGLDGKDDVDDDNNNAHESVEGSPPLNQTEDIDVETEVKFEVKEEDDDDNNVAPDPICTQCGAVFKSKAALVIHHIRYKSTTSPLRIVIFAKILSFILRKINSIWSWVEIWKFL